MAEQKVAVWCAGEEWCSITATAEMISKKWYPVIIHRLLEEGPIGFNALKRDVGGISSKVLSENLEDLQDKNIVERKIVNEKPVRVEYSLTDMGRSLQPVIDSMKKWGEVHLREPENDE